MSNDMAAIAPSIPASLPDPIRAALSHGNTVDITTTGRRSGAAHRVEVVYHSFGRRLFISGRPGPRDWYANLVAEPRFTFHLKRTVTADLAAHARPIPDGDERREILLKVAQVWRMDPERLIAASPLVEVTILGPATEAGFVAA
jgi:deazaflavin-dependent oxidoreductase (nitroreductase family)